MEFYCGLHLARNTQQGWVGRSEDGVIRCGDDEVRRLAADPNWYWPFRFAIEMSSAVWEWAPDVLAASLSALFGGPANAPDGKAEEQKDGSRRPTELMYRAWPLLDPELVDSPRKELASARPKLRRGPEVIRAFQSSGEAAKTFQFERCPERPEEDRVAFLMGSNDADKEAYSDERPQHRVVVPPFRMLATPVTNAQYELFDPGHRARRDEYSSGDDYPVIYVTWYDAWVFAKWVGGRLPTEAEWEYACRAGTPTKYYTGDEETDLAKTGWYYANSEGHTQPVKGKAANKWHLYDMHGNVREWCMDWRGDYGASEIDNPIGPGRLAPRVSRRQLDPQRVGLPVGVPQRELAGLPGERPRVPRGLDSVDAPGQ